MRDINFFSTYKVAKARSTDIALISILVVVVLAGAIFGGVTLVNAQFAAVQNEIDQNNAILTSKDIVDKLTVLQREKQQVDLLEQYLVELGAASSDISAAKIVGLSLLAVVEKTMPATTQLTGISISTDAVSLDCLSTVSTDPFDFLHALKSSDSFAEVLLASITFDLNGISSFSFECKLKGGATK
jgi:Tfp pilus assembly protein PilN